MSESLNNQLRELFPNKAAKETLRLTLQGLSLGSSDEIEAFARSFFTDDTYSENLDNIRGKISTARENYPVRSTVTEAAGAALPALGGLLFSPFTGGSSNLLTAPTIARLARQGAVMGGTYGFNTGEGGAVERAKNVPINAAIGGVTNPFATKLTQAATAPVRRVGSRISGLLKGAGSTQSGVEIKNLLNAAAPAASTAQQISNILGKGQTIAETNPLYTKTLQGRSMNASIDIPRKTDELVESNIQKLSDNLNKLDNNNNLKSNIQKAVTNDLKQLQNEAVPKYNSAFTQNGNEIFVTDNISDTIFDALNKTPKLEKQFTQLARSEGVSTFFKKNKKGEYIKLSQPTLRQAELFRTKLNEEITKLYKNNNNLIAKNLRNISDNLKIALNDFSPALRNVRSEYSQIFDMKKGFELYKKNSKDFEDFEFALENLLEGKSKTQQTEIYGLVRAGFVKDFKAKLNRSKGSAINSLNDVDKKERKILELIYGGKSPEQLLDIINDISSASSSIKLKNTLGGTTTSREQEISKRMGISSSGVEDIASSINFTNPVQQAFAISRIASRFFKRNKPTLSEKQVDEVVEALYSTDPDFLNKFLSGRKSIQQLEAKLGKVFRGLNQATGRATTATAILETDEN